MPLKIEIIENVQGRATSYRLTCTTPIILFQDFFSSSSPTVAQAEFASKFCQGGITVYNLGQKSRHLHIETINAHAVNGVSAKVTAQLASNVCTLFSSDWGVGITGSTTPVPESDNKIFAHYAISLQRSIVKQGKILPKADEPFNLHLKYAEKVINVFPNLVASYKVELIL